MPCGEEGESVRVSCLIFYKPLPKAVEKGEEASLPKAVADFKF
jgi:hypothetical protein